MKIRIIQLINNFYHDNLVMDEQSRLEPLGQFSVFGYFDALDIYDVDEKEGIWKALSELSQKHLDKKNNRRNLICINNDEETDRMFWKNREDFRFLFITLIRIKDTKPDQLLEKINQMNSDSKRDRYDCCSYLSYDHCEAVIVRESDQFSTGLKKVKELRRIFHTFKMYTIFAVNEKLLQNSQIIDSAIKDDCVNLRLRCIVKDFMAAERYMCDMEKILRNSNPSMEFGRHETFGSSDWLVEINNISLCSILEHYKMGGLFTHTKKEYENAFFNIESEILLKSEGNQENGTMDHGVSEKHKQSSE